MVTLKNVNVINNTVCAEYFPEGNETDIGRIEYDLDKNKVKSIQLCQEDESSVLKTYAHKAIKALKKLIDTNDLPRKQYTYIWY